MKAILFKTIDHIAGIAGYIILYLIIYPLNWIFRKPDSGYDEPDVTESFYN